MKKDTTWEKVAQWYDNHLEGGDTYHENVVGPQLIRMIGDFTDKTIVDVACGQGYITRLLAQNSKKVFGVEPSKSLLEYAKKKGPKSITYYQSTADRLLFFTKQSIDLVTCVLALSNIENYRQSIKEMARILKDDGTIYLVINHPAFRIPKQSSWGFDEEQKIQYRRVDAYLSSMKTKIDMNPGEKNLKQKEYTYSFHRSLQDYMKAFENASLGIMRIEEWISHRESNQGPRKKAEDNARKEFPLFMAIALKKIR